MVKRGFDLVLSGFLLLLLSPLMLATAILLRWKIGSPVLFIQARPGKNGALFSLRKFRTMRNATYPDGSPLPDSDRMTPIGNWIRRLSLDELPQLFNVFAGDMSLVGPRPLLPRYLDRYTAEQARRHEVRPGITGWAQVNGRNAISWEQKFEYDVWYVDHASLTLDLKILYLTLLKVLRRDGINAAGEATIGEFMGSAVPNQKAKIIPKTNPPCIPH